MIIDAGIIISSASFGLDIYDRLKDKSLLRKIDKAYKAALQEWCKNKEIRKTISSRFLDYGELVAYIKTNGEAAIKDPEYISFLKVWESKLRDDQHTYSYIIEILNTEILLRQEKLSEAVSKSSEQNINNQSETSSKQDKIIKEINSGNKQIKRNHAESSSKQEEILKEVKKGIESIEKISSNFESPIRSESHYTERNYLKPQDYIKRSVRDYIKADSLNAFLRPQLYEHKYLIDYLIQEKPEKKIILYSEAQEGKSTELQNLAYETQDCELFNVVFYDLKYYQRNITLSTTVNLEYLTTDNTKRKLLILDGLDEVKDEYRGEVILQIQQIASINPDLYLVVSCRGNFEQTNYIEGFRKLYLNPITYNDITEYIKQKCTQSQSLIEIIKQKELYDLIYNPFYLKTFLQYFQEKGSLPETKPEIYDFVIENSFHIDQKKNPGGLISVSEEAIPLLSKVAFCLQFTERPHFNYNQLRQALSLSQHEIQTCCKYIIFKKDIDGNYGFTHSAFKEYLTAKYLSNISFEKLKASICYPQTNILRPYLYNTITLLVSILKKENLLLKSLIEWLAENSIETLFMCEKHFLSNQRRVDIFKAYFEQLKKYGDYINFQRCERIMSFANIREAILYLFEEIKKDSTLSYNLSNAVSLLEYANINVLESKESDELYEYGLELIKVYQSDRDQAHLIFDLFQNRSYKTPQRIAELHDVIKDCENPRILNLFFRLVKDTDLSDNYINWIISKKDLINDYTSSSGVTTVVNKDPLIDVLASVKNNSNIIQVLEIVRSESIHHFDTDKLSECVICLFDNLKSSPEPIYDTQIQNILEILCTERIMYSSIGDKKAAIINAYREFLFVKNLDETIFVEYFAGLKKEIITPSCNNIDHSNLIWQYLNVLSTIMTDERFEIILNDTDLSEVQKFHDILNRLGAYEIICSNNDWIDIIEAQKDKYIPQNRDYKKSTQDGFDILLDYERFKNEIHAIKQKYPTLSSHWEERTKQLIENRINESIIAFIWDFIKRDVRNDNIQMGDIVKKANNPTIFEEFMLSQIIHYLKYKITISDCQQAKINLLINNWVDNMDNCSNIHYLTQLIVNYNVKLSDTQLLSFVPYSHYTIKENDMALYDEYPFEKSLLHYIEDNISDKSLIIHKIDSIITNGNQFWPPLYYTFTDYIVIHHIDSLFKHFKKMLFMDLSHCQHGTYSNYRLSIAERILNLGQEGLEIMNIHLKSLDEETKIHFYEIIIRNENLHLNENEIINDLKQIYKTNTGSDIETIICLLLLLGDTEALKNFLSYFKNYPDSFQFNRPVFNKFDYDQIEIIKQIFEIHHTTNSFKSSSIQETAFMWLNNIAMKTEESRDHVIAYYEHLLQSNPKSYFYLLRVSKNLYNKYYENNSHDMSITDAIKLYADIC